MGKKRKVGGAVAEETIPAKRSTPRAAAKPSSHIAPATATSRGKAAKSNSSNGKGAGVGKCEGPGPNQAQGASIDDMFGQLKSKKKAADAVAISDDAAPAANPVRTLRSTHDFH